MGASASRPAAAGERGRGGRCRRQARSYSTWNIPELISSPEYSPAAWSPCPVVGGQAPTLAQDDVNRDLGVGLLVQRLLEPGDVPVAAELATGLGEHPHALEAEPLVERDRLRVRERDPRVRAVEVLAL